MWPRGRDGIGPWGSLLTGTDHAADRGAHGVNKNEAVNRRVTRFSVAALPVPAAEPYMM